MNRERESTKELLGAVIDFMSTAGQTICKLNVRQACLYTGLQIEELAEKIDAIVEGTITPSQRAHLEALSIMLHKYAKEFRDGMHEGDILRSNYADLIDADFDLAWVSLGALVSTSPDPVGAVAHGTFTNLDKFVNGVALKDGNGKVMKRPGWQQPDFSAYIDTLVRK